MIHSAPDLAEGSACPGQVAGDYVHGRRAVLQSTLVALGQMQRDQASRLQRALRQAPDLSAETKKFAATVFQTLRGQCVEAAAVARSMGDASSDGAGESAIPPGDWSPDPTTDRALRFSEVTWLEGIYLDLSRLAIGYVAAHSLTQGLAQTTASEVTLAHLGRLQNLVREARTLLPGVVARQCTGHPAGGERNVYRLK